MSNFFSITADDDEGIEENDKKDENVDDKETIMMIRRLRTMTMFDRERGRGGCNHVLTQFAD